MGTPFRRNEVKKVSAALAFLFNPKILILDEPYCWSGFQSLVEILKAKDQKRNHCGKALFFIPHIFWNDLESLRIMRFYIFEGEVFSMIPLTVQGDKTG